MTRSEARRRERRRKRRIKRIQRICAWVTLVAFEVLVAGTPTAIIAMILLPMVERQRGYEAFGGEWILIALVFCTAFNFVHQRICDKIYEGEEVRE